jgi:hypothetical protein
MAKIETTAQVADPAIDVPQETLTQILQRLNKLEAENAELKSKGENKLSKAKEKYK